MTLHAAQLQPYSLAGAGGVIGDTTIILKSFKDIDGTNLTMASFGDELFLTMEPGNNTLEEQIKITTVVQNANGTAALGGVKSVLFLTPYTETTGLSKTHAGSTAIVVSNTSGYYNKYAIKENDETIGGQWTFLNTPIVPGTVSDASTTVKGVAKVSVAPVLASNPIAVGDNDPRVPTQNENDALVGTGTPSSSDKYVNSSTLTAGYVANTSVYSTANDQTQTTQNASYANGEANATGKHALIAEKFVAGIATLRGVSLWKAADTGTVVGTMKVAIQADSAGNPSGSDLASYTITNAVWLKLTAAAEFSIAFSSEVTLTVGSSYWIVLTPSTADNSNHTNFGINTAGGYASGALKFNNTTDGWTLTSTSILYFKTLTGINSKVVETGTDGLVLPAVRPYSLLDFTAVSTNNTSTTETAVYSKQLAGGSFNSTSGLRIKNFFLGGAGGSTSGNITIRYKVNGTTIATTTLATISFNTAAGGIGEFMLVNNASTSSQQYALSVQCSTNNAGTATSYSTTIGGTSSVDMTEPLLVEITYQSSAASVQVNSVATSLEKIG